MRKVKYIIAVEPVIVISGCMFLYEYQIELFDAETDVTIATWSEAKFVDAINAVVRDAETRKYEVESVLFKTSEGEYYV